MRRTAVLLLIALPAACLPVMIATSQEPAQSAPRTAPAGTQSHGPKSGTLWIIPHTHWEGAVFKTREEYLEEGLPHILQALELLRAFPDYRFVLDQVAYVKPFLERYPAQAAEFRKLVSQGRLQIVGANDVMLDVNIPSGESWVRQVNYGKDYYRRQLGLDVATGWALDTFGHHAQMPQLLKLAGYKSYWFQRGVRDNRVPSEFLWEGIDGTRIPAFWLPLGYGLFYPTPRSLFEFDRYTRGQWHALGRFSSSSDRVALAGADVVPPERELHVAVEEFNRQAEVPFSVRFAVPSEFEQIASGRTNRPVIGGELNPIFQGVYSSRIELKQWMREDERILTTAEKLAAIAEWLGIAPDENERWTAWEPVLFNEAHDLASGTMVDKVYLDTIRGYQVAKDRGDQMVEASLKAIAANIETRASKPGAVPILVFNTVGWTRTDFAEADVGFSEPDVRTLTLEGPNGEEEPIQLVKVDRYTEGGIRHARVAFIARSVPAVGWAVYYVIPRHAEAGASKLPAADASGSEGAATNHVDSGSIENEFYRATFDLWTGAMAGLRLKSAGAGWEALGKPANVVAEEQDGGDLWELYGTLNGARFTAMTREQGAPKAARAHFSDEWIGGSGTTIPGPVFSEFHISHPFGDGRYSTRVRVYPGVERLDFETKILNNDKFVRYRLLVPSSIKTGRRFDEIPFGAIERPESREFPAQNWIDYSDGKNGLALVNLGLPGNNVSDGTLMLSLMRSARITAYPFFGGYEPGVSSDLGLELGQERTFHYALVPHAGDWREAEVFRAGLEFNNPLLTRPLSQHPGSLPKKWGMLQVTPSNVVLSAVTPAPNGRSIIVRVYEAAGGATRQARIRLEPRMISAEEVNLVGDRVRNLEFSENTLSFDLGSFEIKTFKVGIETASVARARTLPRPPAIPGIR